MSDRDDSDLDMTEAEFDALYLNGEAVALACPTGFAMCDGKHDPTCDVVRTIDGDCRKWGEV